MIEFLRKLKNRIFKNKKSENLIDNGDFYAQQKRAEESLKRYGAIQPVDRLKHVETLKTVHATISCSSCFSNSCMACGEKTPKARTVKQLKKSKTSSPL